MNTDTIQAFVDAYRTQDVATAERLLAPDFRFTSPQDDHIDRAAFLDRCFPTATRFATQTVLQLVDVAPDSVFLLYEYELVSGGRYRNAEFLTLRDGQLVESQVFFGGPAAPGSA